MLYVLSMLFRTIGAFLPAVPMMAVFHFIMAQKDKVSHVKTATAHRVMVYVFCLAVGFVLAVTSVPDLYHIVNAPVINLVPFRDIKTHFHQYALNVLLFVPVGCLLPLLWGRFQKWYRVLLCGFLFSLAIEIVQMFGDRITDIDDLMMNTLGMGVGYLLFLLVRRIFPKVSRRTIAQPNHWKWEPYLCLLFVGLSMFIIQPFISDKLWDLVRMAGLSIPPKIR